MKKICLLTTGIISLFLVVGSTNAFAGLSGIIAQGEFSVYKKGTLADKMSGITPVTEETLLVCESNCLIKTKGISLIVQDGTEMAVKKGPDQFNLMVTNGLVDFSLTNQAGKVAFYTADGQYTVGDAMFNASTESSVRGYMQITDDGRAKIGIHEGRMVFSTSVGPQTIDSQDYILLAQASAASAAASASAAGGSGAASASAAAAASAGGTSVATATSATIFSSGVLVTTCTVVTVTAVTIAGKSKGKKIDRASFNKIKTTTKKITSTGTTTTTQTTQTKNKTKSKPGSTKVSKIGSKIGSKTSLLTSSTTTTTTILCPTCPPPCASGSM